MADNIDVYLVRHGQAKLAWSQAKNAGLSEIGQQQAEDVANDLAALKSLQLISSPLLRAQQTAMPLGRRWGVPIQIDGRYQEVPITPNTAERKAWLADIMSCRWQEVSDNVTTWRNAAWEALLALERSSVIFTHFMLLRIEKNRSSFQCFIC